jgi:chloramphenicol 3-O-phosphotransferase
MIILLNGSINAGKTTVSKRLCELLPRTAHVEVDALRDFIGWMPLEESIPINIEAAIAVATVFVQRSLNVVFSYPLRPEDYEVTLREFGELQVAVHCVTLRPRLEVSLTNRGTRQLTDWERSRIEYHYETRLNDPGIGVIIDNSAQSPDETAREILRRIEAKIL